MYSTIVRRGLKSSYRIRKIYYRGKVMTGEYKVDLDIYNGPVDLLLYLIRKEEVNIYDIPIARITDQYLQYVEALQTLDMNIVGDFLVMAATLMYIKSYMLFATHRGAGY